MDRNAEQRLRRRLGNVAYLIGLFVAMLIICLPGFWIVRQLAAARRSRSWRSRRSGSRRSFRSKPIAPCSAALGRAAFRSGIISAIR